MLRSFLGILLFAFAFAQAGGVVEDTPHRWVYADSVAYPSSRRCGDAWLWTPEGTSFPGAVGQLAIPFRVYSVALPGPLAPSFQIENISTEVLQGKPCRIGVAFEQQGAEEPAFPRSAWAGKPYLSDGLWRSDIHVPLLYSSGSGWNLRRSFRVTMSYGSGGAGGNPGKRARRSVLNPVAAGHFGQATQGGLKKTLASLDAAATSGIDWLAMVGVGDDDLATQAEDGWHVVAFDALKDALQDVGLENDLDGIPVGELRLFGSGPDTLGEAMGNLAQMGNRLWEMPLKVVDAQNNGIFDDGDSLIFLGWGTSLWKRIDQGDSTWSGGGMDYYFSSSPYSHVQLFYLGVGGTGLRLGNLSTYSGQGVSVDWLRYVRAEKDNYLRDEYFGSRSREETTGKEWFWAWGSQESNVELSSSELSLSQLKNLPGLVDDSVWLGFSFFPHRSTQAAKDVSMLSYAQRMAPVRFTPFFQGAALTSSARLAPGGTFVYAAEGGRSSGNALAVTLLANANQNDRFDGVSLAYHWDPAQLTSGEWVLPGTAVGRLRIPVKAGMRILKVDGYVPQGFLTVQSGYAEDSIGVGHDVRYYVAPVAAYLEPATVKAMVPRASGVSQPWEIPVATEYLIIAPELLSLPALRLKAFRESGDAVASFRTSVVLAEDIYRDIGGGRPSPVALRDYLRYARARCPDLRFVLLGGDGHYDFRGMRPGSPANLLMPYENEDISTDDFFAVLDSGEAVRYGGYNLDLAVGRLPVNNVEEFLVYLTKAKEYGQTSIMDNDSWRNTVLLLADDAMQRESADGIAHTEQQERVADMIDSNALARSFAVDVRKLYLLQYERDASYQKPEAARDLLARINQGALFAFYFGHGSSTVWSDEGLLKVGSIYELDNSPRYTILGSFACTVGRFDESQVTSLSEVFMKTASKGAIASIGAMRETYPGPNELFASNVLYQALFTSGMTLGEAILLAKRGISGFDYSWSRYNHEKYVLLGEPVISMPDASLQLAFDQDIDSMQALQKMELGGSVSVASGKLRLQVIEGDRAKTLSQDQGNGAVYSTTVQVPGSPIHGEVLAIQGGAFQTQFITPRKIAFGDTNAQIRLWAWTPGQAQVGRGLLARIAISGTSAYADSLQDQVPPAIRIYPCMKSGNAAPYSEAQKVSLVLPACLEVEVEDSTGLDYREEADEGIVFDVEGGEPWHPWPFLEQTGRKATARMQFGSRYAAGEYTFQVMAQDVLGNVAYRSVLVELTTGIKQGLADVFNVPNPMGKNGTTFYFKDLAGDLRSRVTIQIFDQNGKVVNVLRDVRSGETRWDGRDQHGRLLANGLYHYVVQNAVFPSDTGGRRQVFEKKQKLVISR